MSTMTLFFSYKPQQAAKAHPRFHTLLQSELALNSICLQEHT